jgi:hypothetical protein
MTNSISPVRLDPAQRERAAETLTQAFRHDPMCRTYADFAVEPRIFLSRTC